MKSTKMANNNVDLVHNTVLVTFNCKSLKRSINGVRQLCKDADIIALQETWLLPHDLSLLATIDDEFGYTGTSAVDTSKGMLIGRPYGGVALLWRKSLFQHVSVIHSDNPRIAAIEVTVSDSRPMLIISVYMPVDCSDNLLDLTDCLSNISAVIQERNVESVFILGDLNAHPNGLFYKELMCFCSDQEWLCADVIKLDVQSDTYTFISESHGSRRWLDHCIVTKGAWPSVVDTFVKYDVFWSDHLPLYVVCDLNVVNRKTVAQPQYYNKILWGEKTLSQIDKYKKTCSALLRDIDFPVEFQDCCEHFCHNSEHKATIDNLYEKIVSALCEAATTSYEDKNRPSRKKVIVGWNKHVQESHQRARLGFQMWNWYRRPTSGPIYDEMVESRKIFKGRLKWCQDRQEQIKMDLLASHHTKNNFRHFWKCTNKLNARPGLPVIVDGKNGAKDIANIFRDHFTVKSPLGPSQPMPSAETHHVPFTLRIYAKDISSILKHMKRGKSPGHDGLSIEHLQFAGPHLPRVLALLFNFCLGHSYLPENLMKTVVVPIIKNKTGDVGDKANYRPISLATIVAKVLDSVLNRFLDKSIHLHDNQFGFRSGLSTETAILSLKHAVRYYRDRGTPVYACFLDLSKAFDLVSYDILWKKLDEAGLPIELAGIFKYWYHHQVNVVRWANELSDQYQLECGVRQGGLTSPKIFNMYMNALIEGLSGTHVGCFVDGVCFNNISYADDMALLAPSVSALRKLLTICEAYAASHGLLYNVKKSQYMVFGAVGNKYPSHVPPIHLNGVALDKVKEFKYLGHNVVDDLKDDVDIDRERRALSVRANMLARRFARCSDAVKITLFKAYCTSFYSSTLWASYTQRSYNALRIQYNNAFRVLLRLPRFCSASAMFAEARTDTFQTIIRKKTASLLQRVRGSSNSLLRVIADSVYSPIMGHFINLTKSKLVLLY